MNSVVIEHRSGIKQYTSSLLIFAPFLLLVSPSRTAMTPSNQCVRTVHVAGPHVVVYQFPSADAVSEFREEISEMNARIEGPGKTT